jgi:1,4-dihydroxy-2-naphthoyl-CoA synthase
VRVASLRMATAVRSRRALAKYIDRYKQALDIGLVNCVVPPDELDVEVELWCQEILALSPTAIAIAKRSFNADSDSIRGIGGLGMQALSLYYGTEESREGVAAFRETPPLSLIGRQLGFPRYPLEFAPGGQR